MFIARGFEFPCGKTYVMGILNITPDSFSDGGRYFDCDEAIEHALKMKDDGADIIDIGGQSTRPGSTIISENEEWDRIEPIIESVIEVTGLPVSIDTFYPFVAQKALERGANIINDVGGRVDSRMAESIAKYDAGWVIMHADDITNKTDTCKEVSDWLFDAAQRALSLGIKRECICLDPGVGFGKTLEQNYKIIGKMDKIRRDNFTYLLGVSRKRCMGAACGKPSFSLRDAATHSAHALGIAAGVNIVRSHDVEGAVMSAKVIDAVLKERNL